MNKVRVGLIKLSLSKFKTIVKSLLNVDSLQSAVRKIREVMSRNQKELREAILDLTARVRKLKVKPEMEEATRELVSLKEEFKTVTGREWSDLREEGPILLTTNKVRGREVLPELIEMLKQLHRRNFIRYHFYH